MRWLHGNDERIRIVVMKQRKSTCADKHSGRIELNVGNESRGAGHIACVQLLGEWWSFWLLAFWNGHTCIPRATIPVLMADVDIDARTCRLIMARLNNIMDAAASCYMYETTGASHLVTKIRLMMKKQKRPIQDTEIRKTQHSCPISHASLLTKPTAYAVHTSLPTRSSINYSSTVDWIRQTKITWVGMQVRLSKRPNPRPNDTRSTVWVERIYEKNV